MNDILIETCAKAKLIFAGVLGLAFAVLNSDIGIAQDVVANTVQFNNPGAELIVRIDDQSNGVGNDFGIYSDVNTFDVDTPAAFEALRVSAGAKQHTLRLEAQGVGVGTDSPNSGLHVFSGPGLPFTDAAITIENADATVATREQLKLINNGPTRFGMTNANLGTTWSFVTTTDDQFQIRKNGPSTASMAIRANGTFAFAFGGLANLTVQPNGNAFLRGTLSQGSDRNSKKNFAAVNGSEILEKVATLPITQWNYKSEMDSVRHVGPMAQDFHAAFGLGENDTSISVLDASGVALVAIQELNAKLKSSQNQVVELDRRLKEQADVLQRQQELTAQLLERLQQLEAAASR